MTIQKINKLLQRGHLCKKVRASRCVTQFKVSTIKFLTTIEGKSLYLQDNSWGSNRFLEAPAVKAKNLSPFNNINLISVSKIKA